MPQEYIKLESQKTFDFNNCEFFITGEGDLLVDGKMRCRFDPLKENYRQFAERVFDIDVLVQSYGNFWWTSGRIEKGKETIEIGVSLRVDGAIPRRLIKLLKALQENGAIIQIDKFEAEEIDEYEISSNFNVAWDVSNFTRYEIREVIDEIMMCCKHVFIKRGIEMERNGT